LLANCNYVRLILIAVLGIFAQVQAGEVNLAGQTVDEPAETRLAYLVPDRRIPFWDIMARGIETAADSRGYAVDIYSAENDAETELRNTIKAINDGVSGIIVSPTNSSACVTILRLAKQAGIPVVIADIGTEGGEFVSFVSSDNWNGAYQIGRVLAKKMQQLGWQGGRVGIISIPQKRRNGQLRTSGFMKAMKEANIQSADIRQQVTFSYEETYGFSRAIIAENQDLRALWLQGSDRYQAALDAINDSGRMGEILLLTFDAEPEFLELIPRGIVTGAAMQQPFLMGEESVSVLHRHLSGERVKRELRLSVLAVSTENLVQLLPVIRRNVLGQTTTE